MKTAFQARDAIRSSAVLPLVFPNPISGAKSYECKGKQSRSSSADRQQWHRL